MCSLRQKSISAPISVMATFSTPVSVAVPPLPGATKTFCTRGLLASFHASACSRPPDPTTRIFMSVPEVTHAGKDHGEAALVGGGDHFFVAHAAAGLDDGLGARVGEHFDTVTKREEGVGGDDRALQRKLGRLRF